MLAERQNVAVEHRNPVQPEWQPRVEPRQQTRSRSFFDKASMVGCIVLTAGVFWFLASNSAKVDVMNRSVAQLQASISQVSAQNAALQTQVNELKRPSRILSIALNKLHMVYANPVEIQTSGTSSK